MEGDNGVIKEINVSNAFKGNNGPDSSSVEVLRGRCGRKAKN